MATAGPQLLRLSDISLLARVQRPVVTTWRSRYATRSHPFPAPSAVDQSHEWFDGEAVVDWLEVTERGNNPQARQDLVAFTLAGSKIHAHPETFAGLTALICLRAATGPLPADVDDLLDIAESFDSDDELLFSELFQLGSALGSLARYADLLVASAFDPASLFDGLARRRQIWIRHQPAHPLLRRLVARAALGLADEAGFVEPVFIIRAIEDVDLMVELAAHAEGRGSMRVALALTSPEWPSSAARLSRRWLHVHGLAQDRIVVDDDGAYELPDQGVLVLRLAAASSERAVDLGQVSNLCLNLSKRNRALVVGPAATLTDALIESRGPGRPAAEGAEPSAAAVTRSDALRTGSVRAVVRLPQGLVTEQSRARTALWALGPSRSTPARTLCADVAPPLDSERADDLITDLIAAMRGFSGERAHQPSSGEYRPTSDLIVATGDLVTPGAREVHLAPATVMSELVEVLQRASTPVAGIVSPELAMTEQLSGLPRTTVGQAVDDQQIIVISGARIDSAATVAGGRHPVVRHPGDLARRVDLAGLNPMALATAFPHVVRTRPGDIVVTGVGGPAAVVDRLGGAVVAFPSRVFRCHRPRESSAQERAQLAAQGRHPQQLADQRFTPESVAADINAQPKEAASWKAWPLTVLPPEQLASVEMTLSELAERRERLVAARADIDTAIRTLTQAVGTQICTLRATGSNDLSERTTR